MQNLLKGKNSFIQSDRASVEGYTPVKDGDLALHSEFGVVQLTMVDGNWVYQRLGYAGNGADLNNLSPIVFRVGKSHNDMNAIEIRDPDPAIRAFIVSAMRANMLGDPAYETRTKAGAFLQGNSKHYVLIEFWQANYAGFVEHLNQTFQNWYLDAMKDGLLEYLIESLD